MDSKANTYHYDQFETSPASRQGISRNTHKISDFSYRSHNLRHINQIKFFADENSVEKINNKLHTFITIHPQKTTIIEDQRIKRMYNLSNININKSPNKDISENRIINILNKKKCSKEKDINHLNSIGQFSNLKPIFNSFSEEISEEESNKNSDCVGNRGRVDLFLIISLKKFCKTLFIPLPAKLSHLKIDKEKDVFEKEVVETDLLEKAIIETNFLKKETIENNGLEPTKKVINRVKRVLNSDINQEVEPIHNNFKQEEIILKSKFKPIFEQKENQNYSVNNHENDYYKIKDDSIKNIEEHRENKNEEYFNNLLSKDLPYVSTGKATNNIKEILNLNPNTEKDFPKQLFRNQRKTFRNSRGNEKDNKNQELTEGDYQIRKKSFICELLNENDNYNLCTKQKSNLNYNLKNENEELQDKYIKIFKKIPNKNDKESSQFISSEELLCNLLNNDDNQLRNSNENLNCNSNQDKLNTNKINNIDSINKIANMDIKEKTIINKNSKDFNEDNNIFECYQKRQLFPKKYEKKIMITQTSKKDNRSKITSEESYLKTEKNYVNYFSFHHFFPKEHSKKDNDFSRLSRFNKNEKRNEFDPFYPNYNFSNLEDKPSTSPLKKKYSGVILDYKIGAFKHDFKIKTLKDKDMINFEKASLLEKNNNVKFSKKIKFMEQIPDHLNNKENSTISRNNTFINSFSHSHSNNFNKKVIKD